MTDRVPGAPGQFKAVILPDQLAALQNGEEFTIKLTRDDKPIVEGTPYSKAAVLPDELAKEICPKLEDPTPADALAQLLFMATWASDLAEAISHDALFSSGGTMTGAIAMGGNKITGLGTPTAAADAVTKAYADGKIPKPAAITDLDTTSALIGHFGSSTNGNTFLPNCAGVAITYNFGGNYKEQYLFYLTSPGVIVSRVMTDGKTWGAFKRVSDKVSFSPNRTSGSHIGTININGEETKIYAPSPGSNVSFSPNLTSGSHIGTININGEETKIYAPSPGMIQLFEQTDFTTDSQGRYILDGYAKFSQILVLTICDPEDYSNSTAVNKTTLSVTLTYKEYGMYYLGTNKSGTRVYLTYNPIDRSVSLSEPAELIQAVGFGYA